MYNDFLIRDYIGDNGNAHTRQKYWSSPDIIPYQQELLDIKTATEEYRHMIAKQIINGQVNNCYVRVRNMSYGDLMGVAYLYHVDASFLNHPSKWVPVEHVSINKNGELVREAAVPLTSGRIVSPMVDRGIVGITKSAFMLDDSFQQIEGHHYCFIALVSSWFNPYSIDNVPKNMDNVAYAKWVRTHPNVAQLNLSIVEPKNNQLEYTVGFGNASQEPRNFAVYLKFYSMNKPWPQVPFTVTCTDVGFPYKTEGVIPAPDSQGNQIYALYLKKVPGNYYNSFNIIINIDDPKFAGGVELVYKLELSEKDKQDQELMGYSVADMGRKEEKVHYITMGTCYMICGNVPQQEWRRLLRMDEV